MDEEAEDEEAEVAECKKSQMHATYKCNEKARQMW